MTQAYRVIVLYPRFAHLWDIHLLLSKHLSFLHPVHDMGDLLTIDIEWF